MHRTPPLFFSASKCTYFHTSHRLASPSIPIIRITNGTFYRQHPSSKPASGQEATSNSALFPDLTFSIPSFSSPKEHWAILSPLSTVRTTFLNILQGQLLCLPPTARTFPYLLSDELKRKNGGKPRSPDKAIEYVGFDVERRAFGGAYLSARYESRVESTDFTLSQYLTGITSMNPGEDFIKERTPDEVVMRKVVRDLELERGNLFLGFFDKPVSTLSNGQSRRARIGKALLAKPEMLCLDAPFIGLDPFVSKHISQLLHSLADAGAPRIVLSLRDQDDIPDWITHLVYAEDGMSEAWLGTKESIVSELALHHSRLSSFPDKPFTDKTDAHILEEAEKEKRLSVDAYEEFDRSEKEGEHFKLRIGEPVVEMEGVRIKYGGNSVLGDWQQDVNGTQKDGLWWNVHRGQRWGIFGANGSGKTTLLSLVLSDHPQTYSAPVKLFQRSRLPEPGVPGITIFDIQTRMGHASPEVHALFPKNMSVKRTIETAWSDTPITKPRLDSDAEKRVEACLRWFEAELNPLSTNPVTQDSSSKNLDWADRLRFGELAFSAQRVLLFLRTIIRNPDVVILDEAFSGMDDGVRTKCLLFLSKGETMQHDYRGASPRPVKSEIAKRGEVVVPGLQEHQALLCVSHDLHDIPGCIREWICLPEAGTGPARFGRFDGPVELSRQRWRDIWDLPSPQ